MLRGYRAGAGDRLHPGLLDRRARLATALQTAGAARRCASSIPRSFGWKAGWNRASCAAPLVLFLLALALRFFLARYEMVYNEHGLPGGHRLRGPERRAAAAVAADRWPAWRQPVLVWMRPLDSGGQHGGGAGGAVRRAARLVAALYVRPNEISIERPYIETHIHATRARLRPGAEASSEIEFKAHPDAPIDPAKHKAAARQRAAVGLARFPRHHHADPGAAALLRFPRYRRGPLHHRRRSTARCC